MRRLYLLFVLVVLLLAMLGSILLGWTVVAGPVTFSVMGVVLLSRWIIQVYRSRTHLREMRKLYTPLLEAIHAVFPEQFSERDVRRWQHWRLNAEMWQQQLFAENAFLQNPENWQAVVAETFRSIPIEQWQLAFPEANLSGDPAVFASELLVAGVPIYGVDPDELQDTLERLEDQSVPFKQIAVALNDPNNDTAREFLQEWVSMRDPSKWVFLDLPEANKKAAMAAAVTTVEGQIFVNVDSDTAATYNANFFTLLAFVMFPHLHGLTSNVRIKNLGPLRSSLLQWLTYFRYDAVNNVERGARRWNETVLSGPWLAVRQASFLEFLDDWFNFTFAGKPVRPGDDRRITFELNRRKLAAAYVPQVIVYTDCPDTIKRWYAQQSRWTLSYYVNMWDSFISGQAWQLSLWSLLDQVYGGFFSFFLLGAVGSVTFQAVGKIHAGDETGKFLLSIAWEAKLLSHKQYEEIAFKLNDVGKMLGGWRKNIELSQNKNRTNE